mmetsp:Transcript_77205/g.136241  ORF Transcript_77205/g.136241 Transcript_77205/m.136241 type:complete len:92 (+) Transcript_77205:607-882(+)
MMKMTKNLRKLPKKLRREKQPKQLQRHGLPTVPAPAEFKIQSKSWCWSNEASISVASLTSQGKGRNQALAANVLLFFFLLSNCSNGARMDL